MGAQSYLQVDGTLPVIENLTDEEILAEVLPDQNVGDEDDEGVMTRNRQCRCPGERCRKLWMFCWRACLRRRSIRPC
uniref:Uncharacterized protein n=1 Tax=Hyaloperonospora arabidopsidis (strain Emoy2) TaxID=559515 RepID=M4BT18_HYAAE